jgi:hypothetical protein
MPRRYLTAALALVAIAAAAPATAAAGAKPSKTSHAKLWQNKRGTVDCGLEIPRPSTHVICSAENLPVPKHNVGDPFVQIGAHGKPVVVYLSQDSFITDKLATLKAGTKWSSIGVSCTVGSKTVKCSNKSKHGFTIGKGKYKPF